MQSVNCLNNETIYLFVFFGLVLHIRPLNDK